MADKTTLLNRVTEGSAVSRGERYTAESLEDIARHFERLAKSESDMVDKAGSINRYGRVKNISLGASWAFHEAARILRATKLKGL